MADELLELTDTIKLNFLQTQDSLGISARDSKMFLPVASEV
jgi:hypothetical protein